MSDEQDASFFIGWAETPERDRRFFLRTGAGLLIGSAGLAGVVAGLQRPVGRGQWDFDLRDFRGVVTQTPYPMLRTLDIDGTPQTALLACQTKCGVEARLKQFGEGPVVIRGSLIQRGDYAMIAVADGPDWVRADESDAAASLAFAAPVPSGELTLAGEILDSKCWFGAMRPADGKVHKACASLCIRSGIPPSFIARDANDNAALLIMTEQGGRFTERLLAHVADPVEITGAVSRINDVWVIDVVPDQVHRI